MNKFKILTPFFALRFLESQTKTPVFIGMQRSYPCFAVKVEKYEFESLRHAREVFSKFYETYNAKRILKCLLNKTQKEFLKEWGNDKLMVVYNIKTKKQKFFFREKQNLIPVLLPSRRNF